VEKVSALLVATVSSGTKCAGPITTTRSKVPRPRATRAYAEAATGPEYM